MQAHTIEYPGEFTLENNETIHSIKIRYHTYGTYDPLKSKVVWVCHALTANSNALDWWDTLFHPQSIFLEENYFIICANIVGSCYGTEFKTSAKHPVFPTIRDQIHFHQWLKDLLNISTIHYLIGGSMGGYQALEWAYENSDIKHLVLVATAAAETPWGIAIHTAQRMAIEADPNWLEPQDATSAKGLMAARAIGMLTYRNYSIFKKSQTDNQPMIDQFKAESYIRYQGQKLAHRFQALNYWLLTKTMDSHHLGRGRDSLEQTLSRIDAKTLVVGIQSDLLCPIEEQRFLAKHIPNSKLVEIDSPFGHDGFLVEGSAIEKAIRSYYF